MSNSAVEGIRKYIKEIYPGGLIGISDLADYCHESEGIIMKSLVKLEMTREIRIVTKYFCPEAHSMEEGSTYCSACDQKYPQEMIHSLVYCEPITINRQMATAISDFHY
jgi:hypothetical protein